MSYPKKSLGQNFLIDSNIIKKIINLSEIFNKNIIEIGPGKGALTEEILKKRPKSLVLIEKDNSLCDELKSKFKKNKKIIIFNEDILKFNLQREIKKNTIIFGNLPYNIASQILVKIIRLKNWPPKYSALIFMFQKEMAERISGKYGTSKYGRLSILTNYILKIDNSFNISANCFYPKPKVTSTVLCLKPKKKIEYKIKEIKNLEKITNILFSNRRKMINKNMIKIFSKEKIQKIIKKVDLQSRPSELNPETYYKLTGLFETN